MSNAPAIDSSTSGAEPFYANTLASSALLILAITIAQRLIGIARSLAVATLLDPGELGQWDLAFTFLGIAAPVTVLGLPGSFGRYVERYAQQGQLKMLLRRTIGLSALLACAAMLAITVARPWFAQVIFGNTEQASLVLMLAGVLGTVILFNFLGSLLSALRMYRVFAGQQFICSVCFALFSIWLLFSWQKTAVAIVAAYGAACLITAVASSVCLWRIWPSLPDGRGTASQWKLWSTLLPFSLWIWFNDLATNLLASIDRYMLIHYSTLDVDEVLAAIGQYHCARIVPAVLTTLAYMAATMLTPHLARKWELGQRAEVSDQLHFILKLACWALTCASVIVLLLAELFVDFGHGQKYAPAITILPGTLLCGVWLGLVGISQNYLWCAERAWWGALTIVAGILCNVAMSVLLLPHYGLEGAVTATAIANLLVIACILTISRRLGMQNCRATWAMVALPAALWLGGWCALGVLLCALGIAIHTEMLLDRREKALLTEGCRQYLAILRRLWNRRSREHAADLLGADLLSDRGYSQPVPIAGR